MHRDEPPVTGRLAGIESMSETLLKTSILTVGLVVSILIGIGFVVWIRSRYRGHEDAAADEQQMLSQMGDLYRRGDLSEEEYRSIKGRLAQRIDDSTRR